MLGQRFPDLEGSPASDAVESTKRSEPRKSGVYQWFRKLSPKEQEHTIARLREKNLVYIVKKDRRYEFTRVLDAGRLFVELLGVTFVAGAAFLLTGPRKEG